MKPISISFRSMLFSFCARRHSCTRISLRHNSLMNFYLLSLRVVLLVGEYAPGVYSSLQMQFRSRMLQYSWGLILCPDRSSYSLACRLGWGLEGWVTTRDVQEITFCSPSITDFYTESFLESTSLGDAISLPTEPLISSSNRQSQTRLKSRTASLPSTQPSITSSARLYTCIMPPMSSASPSLYPALPLACSPLPLLMISLKASLILVLWSLLMILFLLLMVCLVSQSRGFQSMNMRQSRGQFWVRLCRKGDTCRNWGRREARKCRNLTIWGWLGCSLSMAYSNVLQTGLSMVQCIEYRMIWLLVLKILLRFSRRPGNSTYFSKASWGSKISPHQVATPCPLCCLAHSQLGLSEMLKDCSLRMWS